MIDVKDAATIAMQYAGDMYSNQNISGVLLEEIEITDDDRYWFVTLSFERDESSSSFGFVSRQRILRRIKINAETGEVRALNIKS